MLQVESLSGYTELGDISNDNGENARAVIRQWALPKFSPKVQLELVTVIKRGWQSAEILENFDTMPPLDRSELETNEIAGKDALDILTRSYGWYLYKLANQRAHRGLGIIELVNEGAEGIEHGVRKFNFEKKTAVSTYLHLWMVQRMNRALQEQPHTISATPYMQEVRAGILKQINILTQRLGRHPEMSEISKELDMDEDEIFSFLHCVRQPLSFELPVGSGDNDVLVLGDTIQDDVTLNPEEALMEHESINEIKKRWGLLTEREQLILAICFASDPAGENLSVRKIENVLATQKNVSMSHSQVNIDKERALYILRTGERYPKFRPPRITVPK